MVVCLTNPPGVGLACLEPYAPDPPSTVYRPDPPSPPVLFRLHFPGPIRAIRGRLIAINAAIQQYHYELEDYLHGN